MSIHTKTRNSKPSLATVLSACSFVPRFKQRLPGVKLYVCFDKWGRGLTKCCMSAACCREFCAESNGSLQKSGPQVKPTVG